MPRSPIIALTLAAAITGWPAVAMDLADLRSITFPDQHGRESRVADLADPMVITVVTVKRLRNVRPWERFLAERYPALATVRIADLPADSPANLDDVAAKLRERVPEEVSVLIDIEGKWADSLGLDTSRPNLLIIDASGELVASFQGRHSPELEAEVATAIDALVGGR